LSEEVDTLRKDRTKTAFFVTGNIHKFHEAREVLSKFNIATAMVNLETAEIQADDVQTIAEASVTEAAAKSRLPVFVEDAGLFVKSLKGFPGPYSSYVYRTIGTDGILRLMRNIDRREAYFQSVIAFCSPNDLALVKCFSGKVEGKIAHKEKGKQGFGFDPIFEPNATRHKTFAEMTTQEKNRYSHRARALQKFVLWHKHNM
jgi:XTP/dITP diphosphohydrolase